MTTTLHLVRHGSHGRLDRVLCGRMDGVGLSADGLRGVEALSARLSRETIDALYTSPLQRCRETAEAAGRSLGLEVRVEDDLQEIDFGRWTGKTFEELDADPLWSAWNTRRSLTRPPGGEGLGEAQMRAARLVDRLAAAHPEAALVLVTHSDIVKALVCLWLGVSLDNLQRFEVAPASLTTAVVGEWGVKLLRLNEEAKL